MVASALNAGYSKLPSAADDWFLGVQSKAIQLEVNLLATVTAPNGNRTLALGQRCRSTQNGSYAIKGWTVDPNVGVAPHDRATRPRRRRRPRRPRRAADDDVDADHDHDDTAADTTTTTDRRPGRRHDGRTARDCGTGTVDRRVLELALVQLARRQPGTPRVTRRDLPSIDYNGRQRHGPVPGINDDYYTARFTKTVNVTSRNCKISLHAVTTASACIDGQRCTMVASNWAAHAYKTYTVNDSAERPATTPSWSSTTSRAGRSPAQLGKSDSRKS